MRVCSTKWRKCCGKKSFYDKLKCECDMHSADDLVMCFGDFNGHVGRHIYGFDGVTGRYGQRNLIECYHSFLWRRNYVCEYMVYERGKEEGGIQNG